jgi:hypothetical protein
MKIPKSQKQRRGNRKTNIEDDVEELRWIQARERERERETDG